MFGVNLGSPHQIEGQPPDTDYRSSEHALGTLPPEVGWWNTPQLFKTDLELTRDLGIKSARIGIEWARVEPEPDRIDTQAVRHYQSSVDHLLQLGIKPVITLYHFTLPRHIAVQGGWSNPATVAKFRNFSRLVTNEISTVPYIITMNEPSVFLTNGYLKGIWPPNLKLSPQLIVAFLNVVKAHNSVYESLKQTYPQVQVGISEALRGFVPTDMPQTAEARTREFLLNELFFTYDSKRFPWCKLFWGLCPEAF